MDAGGLVVCFFGVFFFYAKRIDHHVNMAVNQAFDELGQQDLCLAGRVGHRLNLNDSDSSI